MLRKLKPSGSNRRISSSWTLQVRTLSIEKNRPQLAALELLVKERRTLPPINRVQRLKTVLPERHHHVAIRDLRQEMRDQAKD